MGSSASTQRKPNQIKPEACSCKSPGWRTRPRTDPLIYQQLAPTSAPPQLKPTSRIFIIYYSLCFKNSFTRSSHPKRSSTHPPRSQVTLSSGVSILSPASVHCACTRWTWLSWLFSLRLVSHRRTYPCFIIRTKEKANISGMYSHRNGNQRDSTFLSETLLPFSNLVYLIKCQVAEQRPGLDLAVTAAVSFLS